MSGVLPVAPPDDASRNYRRALLLHWVYSTVPILLVVSGELLSSTSGGFGPNGFIDAGRTGAWLFRGFFALMAVQSLAIVFFFGNERRAIRRVMKVEPNRADLAVSGSLAALRMMRAIQIVAIAVYGFILFCFTGDRLDLYVPTVISLVLLVVTRPSRAQWERTFREASAEYPTISSSPW